MAVNIRKAESIAAIKYVGRQHSFLTSIMERINACYAYQVFVFKLNGQKKITRKSLILSIPLKKNRLC